MAGLPFQPVPALGSNRFKSNPELPALGHGKVEFFETNHTPIAVFHKNDFITSLLGYVFFFGFAKPNRQSIAFPVVKNLYLGHILSPSFIASVIYVVIKNPSLGCPHPEIEGSINFE
jgi:hypothetical protein